MAGEERWPLRGRWLRDRTGGRTVRLRGFFGSLRSSLSLVSKLRFVPVRQQSPRGLFLVWPSRTIATQESVIIHTQRVTEHGRKSLIETKGRAPLTDPRNTQDDLRIHQGEPLAGPRATRHGEADSESLIWSGRTIQTSEPYILHPHRPALRNDSSRLVAHRNTDW